MLTLSQLQQMGQLDIETVDPDALIDLKSVHVDAFASVSERVCQYFDQVQNPYAFRVGEVAVKVEFSPTGAALHDALKAYLTALREGT